jgi:hypothetical protein
VIRRLLAAAVVFAGIELTLGLNHYDLHPVQIALLVALGVMVLGLLLELDAEPRPRWPSREDRAAPVAVVERELASYARLVERDRRATVPDPWLRQIVGRVADERLRRRHGLQRSDPRAADLLGRDLLDFLDGPPRRTDPAQLAAYLDRIESL